MALPAPRVGQLTPQSGAATPEGREFGMSALQNMMYADMANQASLAAQRFIQEWEQKRARKKAKEKAKKKKGGLLGGGVGGALGAAAGIALAPVTGGSSLLLGGLGGALGAAGGGAIGGNVDPTQVGMAGLGGAIGGGMGQMAGMGAMGVAPLAGASGPGSWGAMLGGAAGGGMGAMGAPYAMPQAAGQARYMQNMADPNFDPYGQNRQAILQLLGMGMGQPGGY